MNNIIETLMKLQQFKSQLQGRNPQDILNQMVSSGRFTQAQVDDARKKAEAIANALNMKN